MLHNIYRKYKKSFLFIFCISLLYVFPLILANFYFIDDLRRMNYNVGWESLGRPFADILLHILNAGSFIDIFPLTLIISCIFVGISIILLSNRLSLNYNYFISTLIYSPFYVVLHTLKIFLTDLTTL